MIQTVQVPTTGSATLRFWYRVISQDTLEWDYLRVVLRDSHGTPLEELLRVGSPHYSGCAAVPWDSGWQQGSFSLHDYQGQRLQIYFENRLTNADGWYNTYAYVDDVDVVP